jgi:hypothetical protein
MLVQGLSAAFGSSCTIHGMTGLHTTVYVDSGRHVTAAIINMGFSPCRNDRSR